MMNISARIILALILIKGYHQANLLPTDSDVGLNVVQLIEKYGYPVETHHVTTEDGYILCLHRIPYGKKNNDTTINRVPILLEHGMMSSSADYVNMGPDLSLGYLLADMGYDVWMGNARGNTWSRNHTTLSTDDAAFWQFSWHEIGVFDLPAIIDYLLDVTGHDDLQYIGHSQGTTVLIVMGAEQPEYNQKIRLASLMAPVAFMGNMSDSITQYLAQYVDYIEEALDNHTIYEFPYAEDIRNYLSENCQDGSELQDICVEILFYIGGARDEAQLNRTTLPVIFTSGPANNGVKQFIHYGQEVKSQHFRKYDYGPEQNLITYGTEEPPDYDLTKVTMPIALYYGKNDDAVSVNDVNKLSGLLPNVVKDYLIPYELFNHIDFLFAIDVIPLLYEEMFGVIDQY